MDTPAPYHVAYIAEAAPDATTPHAALVTALAAFQAEANGLLVAAGYPHLTAQVSAGIQPCGIRYQVSASDPSTVFYNNLSFGMAATPEKALDEFSARLMPALALTASLTEFQRAA